MGDLYVLQTFSDSGNWEIVHSLGEKPLKEFIDSFRVILKVLSEQDYPHREFRFVHVPTGNILPKEFLF